MLFNSLQFLLFFIIVCSVYYVLPLILRWVWLLIASCYFYAVLNPYYLLILATAIGVDYCCGMALSFTENKVVRTWILTMSILSNIAILGYFKYYNFFIDNLTSLSTAIGHPSQFNYLSLVLPIGLSFHTFQSMSYCIEVYRKRQTPEKNLLVFALYVMFFPQLVAGPIERPYNLLGQLKVFQKFSSEHIKSGLLLIGWGLFKKVVISDRIAMYVNDVFKSHTHYSSLALFISIIFFAFQIYCDFSGYSDMARGTARVMGYNLMINFNTPYFSTSLKEFWTRWHISLSSWFRDYVYIPLGGSKVPFARYAFNIIVVFLLSGLWHGANWTFVIWGLLHGAFILVSAIFTMKFSNIKLPSAVAVIITFLFVCITWIFFRAPNVSEAMSYLYQMLTFQQGALSNIFFSTQHLVFSFGLIAVLLILEKFATARLLQTNLFYLKCMCFILVIYYLGIFNQSQFIYFQF